MAVQRVPQHCFELFGTILYWNIFIATIAFNSSSFAYIFIFQQGYLNSDTDDDDVASTSQKSKTSSRAFKDSSVGKRNGSKNIKEDESLKTDATLPSTKSQRSISNRSQTGETNDTM